MHTLSLAIFAFLLFASLGCGNLRTAAPATQGAPRTLTFMAGYKPQANLPFVGVYVANDLGYFAEQGLNVEIQHATGQGEHLKLMLQGTVDVTTSDADAVLKRRAEQDLPLVAFSLFGQRGAQTYAVLQDSNIQSPKDFEGKIVGYKIYPTPDYLAMLERTGTDRSKIDEVAVGFDPRVLAERRVDVYPVFTSNEPDLLQRIGFPTRLFDPADYGVPTLGLTYITRRELVEQDPDVLARFLKATLRGIGTAQTNPEAAIDVVMRYAAQENRSHQLSMLQSELEMATGPVVDQLGMGWATRDQWLALENSLLQQGGIERPVDIDTAFTDQILHRVYRDRILLWP